MEETPIRTIPGKTEPLPRKDQRQPLYYIVSTNPVDRLDTIIALGWVRRGFAEARRR